MPSRGTTGLRHAVVESLRELLAAGELLDATLAEHLGMHRTDLHCLDFLARTGPVPAGRLGEAVGLTSGALTIAVDRLERQNYVQRTADVRDRRKVLIALAPGAEPVIDLVMRLRRATLRQLSAYSASDLQLIDDFLGKTAAALEQQARVLGARDRLS